MHDRLELRRHILARRDRMTPAERQHRSAMILERLWQVPELRRAALVFTYVNFRSEAETQGLIGRCLAAGIGVTVPLTLPAEKRLVPYAITDLTRDLKPGYCGIPEPDAARLTMVAATAIDVVIVPGSVFDATGGRLGYGGGYYDRFLATDAPAALRIGLAFELQVVAAVPVRDHDQPLQLLVTEERIIRTPWSGGKPGGVAVAG